MRIALFGLLICLCSLRVIAQETEPPTVEAIASFQRGQNLNQLGLGRGGGEWDAPTFAENLLLQPGVNYVWDSVNHRIVAYGGRWNAVRSLPVLGNRYGFQMSSTGGGILLYYGQGNTQVSGGIVWISMKTGVEHDVDMNLGQFVHSRQDYRFLFQYQDVLIFENEAGIKSPLPTNFFGIRGIASESNTPQEYLDDAAVRSLLDDPQNKRYEVGEKAIFDRGQILSIDGETIKAYFNQWTGKELSSATDANSALANGCYFFTSQYGADIIDEKGNVVADTGTILTSDNLFYTDLEPGPDGYLYQVRGDYAKGKTAIYRIGPFPEVRLDYHGRGGVVNNDNVNLRQEASTASQVLSKLSRGTPVRILSVTDKTETIGGLKSPWYQVRLWDRTEGWVFGAFLDVAN